MSRFEDLPWVDEEGYLADQGRRFLQDTDGRISRLGLPEWLAGSQQKIQQLSSPVEQLYRGIEQGISSLPSLGQQAAGAFGDYANDRIATIGQGLGELRAGLPGGPEPAGPSEAQRRLGPIFSGLGTGVRGITDELGTSTRDLGNRMGPQLGESVGRTQQAGRELAEDFTLESPDARSQYEEHAAALARQRSVFDESTTPFQNLRDTAPGGTPSLRDVGTAFTDTLGNLARSDLAPSGYARGGLQSARQRLLETGEELGGGPEGGQLGKIQGSLDAILRAQQRGDMAGAQGAAAGLAGNTAAAAGTALGAIPNALLGGTVGAAVGGERNLARESGLNDWLQQKGLPGVQADTLALGGLSNPASLGGMAGQAALPATVLDDLAGILLRQGARVALPMVERFAREVGPGQIRVALERGTTGLADLFDDFVARAAEAVPGGREGPLGRIIAEEEGALRLPRFGRAAPAAPPTPPATPGNGAPFPNPATPAERAYNHQLQIGEGQAEAALTPDEPTPFGKGSTLATFDDWLSYQRELWTDENARLVDVQKAVEAKLKQPLTADQNVVLKRRLYAGRQAASDQIIADELDPILTPLQPGQVKHVEETLEQLDDVGRVKAIQNRVTAEAAGKEVGPVAGETALRNTNQSLRLRRARLGDALLKQDQADDAYRKAQAEQRRVRTEGRREVRGSQGRGRRRVQRTPAEQAKVEADVNARVEAARTATVDARAARDAAAKQANIDLTKTTRADLKRMRLEGSTEALRGLEEAAIAEDAATKGAETAAARRFSGGVTDVDYDEDAVWEATRQRVANRLDEKYARLGKKATPNEVDAELKTVRGAVEQLQAYSRGLRARLHDAGILSDELYETWERDFPGYLRTNILKYMDEEAATPAGAGAQRFTVNSLVGAGQDVGRRMSTEGTHALRERPVETLIRMTYAAETLARRNENAQALLKLAESDPGGDLAKAMRPLKAGESAGPKEVVFSVYTNGEPQKYAVDARLESLFNLPPSELRDGLKAIGQLGLTGVFKQAVTTYNPAFIGLNAARDYLVYLRREAKNPVQALRATGDLGKAYLDLGSDALRSRARLGNLGREARAPRAGAADNRAAIRLGGGQDAGYAGLPPAQVRNRMLQEPEVAKRATIVTSAKQAADALTKVTGVQAVGRGIRGAGNVVETAPRLAAYRRALRAGKTPEEASLAYRDVTMDFSRGGTRARDWNQAIPFFNAAIQGAARFYRDDLVNRRGVTVAQMAGLFGAKAALDKHNESYGDDWADVPDYLKDTGIILMVPGDVEPERREDGSMVPGQRNFLWYPLPQDLAGPLKVGMSAIRRASGEKAYGFDTGQGWLETAGDVAGGLSPVDFEGGVPLPPLVRQVGEQLANRDVFRDRPIVPEYLAGRPPEQQATPQTSALGRVVGGALGSVGGPGPTRVDYGVTGLLGGTGRQLLTGSDTLARALGRGDLASRPYSSPEDQEALDVLRGAPLVGPAVGAGVRQSGGQLDARAAALLEREITDAQRDATERLRDMPGFQRLPTSEQERILRQEHDKLRRQLEDRGRKAREQRQGQRAQAQYLD